MSIPNLRLDNRLALQFMMGNSNKAKKVISQGTTETKANRNDTGNYFLDRKITQKDLKDGSGKMVDKKYEEGGSYVLAPQGGYVMAPQNIKGGAKCKTGGFIGAVLTALATGAASALGAHVLSKHLTPHIDKFISKVFTPKKYKMEMAERKQFEGEGLKVRTRTTNIGVLSYYSKFLKDLENNLLKAGLNQEQTKKAMSKFIRTLIGKKLLGAIVKKDIRKGGKIYENIATRHIAEPLLIRQAYKYFKGKHPKDQQKAKEKAYKYATIIKKMMPKNPLTMDKPHMLAIAKDLKQIKGEGLSEVKSKDIMNIINMCRTAIKKTGRELIHKHRIKKFYKRYGVDNKIKLPSFKGSKSAEDIINRINSSNLDQSHKNALMDLGFLAVKKKKYKGLGIPLNMTSKIVADTKLSPVQRQMVYREMRNTTVQDLKKGKDSSFVKKLFGYGVPILISMGILGKLLTYAGKNLPKAIEYVGSIAKYGRSGSGISDMFTRAYKLFESLNLKKPKFITKKLIKGKSIEDIVNTIKTSKTIKRIIATTGISLALILLAILGFKGYKTYFKIKGTNQQILDKALSESEFELIPVTSPTASTSKEIHVQIPEEKQHLFDEPPISPSRQTIYVDKPPKKKYSFEEKLPEENPFV